MTNLKNPARFRRLMNLWPPFLGAGISVKHISDDWKMVVVTLKLRWFNRNYVRTHFGGSLFSMTDPFFMLMLMHNLGKNYRVWDQSGRIDFVKPGKGTVTATFRLDDNTMKNIVEKARNGEKHFAEFAVDVVDRDGAIVAKIHKTLYIRRKVAAA